MVDRLKVEGEKIILTTDEGVCIERPASELAEMFRRKLLPPLNGRALPDGIKFVEWREPYLLIVHQLPWQVRRMRWIADDSPADYGPRTKYRTVRLSMPYAITFAMFYQSSKGLGLTGSNELYFKNSPLESKEDRVGFPALLNVSRIPSGKRQRAWICTQYLSCKPKMSWTEQLTALLEHTWNGGFNRSSEHHEGASWYGISVREKIHPDLSPIEKWEEATKKDEAFGVSVPWKDAGQTVGELIECMFQEQGKRQMAAPWPVSPRSRQPKAANLVSQFLNFTQRRSARSARLRKAK